MNMKFVDVVVSVLVLVGAVNWGLVGLFRFDLVAATLSEASLLSRAVYVVIGAAGLSAALRCTIFQRRIADHGGVTADLANLRSTQAVQRFGGAGDEAAIASPESAKS